MTIRRWTFEPPAEQPTTIPTAARSLPGTDHQCALPYPTNHLPGTVARCSVCDTTYVTEGVMGVLVIWVREECA